MPYLTPLDPVSKPVIAGLRSDEIGFYRLSGKAFGLKSGKTALFKVTISKSDILKSSLFLK
jgi:hypothetical protein